MEKGGRGRRQKYVPLHSQLQGELNAVKLPGRHACTCEASRHQLVANCLQCGRIVCSQEGSGPCMTCGAAVGGCGGPGREDATAALQRRDQLLERDRQTGSGGPTTVIDDQRDHFHTGSGWLNPAQRNALQLYRSRLEQQRQDARNTVTLDFAGRRVTADSTDPDACRPEQVQALLDGLRLDRDSVQPESGVRRTCRPQYVESAGGKSGAGSVRKSDSATASDVSHRVQDGQLWSICDDGLCLSVRQPWAALLVTGLKQHEGRSWYSPHRGRLWIAAAAHRPDPAELLQLPDDLPLATSCLLGCVTVEDCLSQEVYRQQFPAGDSDAPYVLICSDPRQLAVRFPVRGQHKIYPLDKQIHNAAQKMISMS